jgi:hypothetical protein
MIESSAGRKFVVRAHDETKHGLLVSEGTNWVLRKLTIVVIGLGVQSRHPLFKFSKIRARG